MNKNKLLGTEYICAQDTNKKYKKQQQFSMVPTNSISKSLTVKTTHGCTGMRANTLSKTYNTDKFTNIKVINKLFF